VYRGGGTTGVDIVSVLIQDGWPCCATERRQMTLRSNLDDDGEQLGETNSDDEMTNGTARAADGDGVRRQHVRPFSGKRLLSYVFFTFLQALSIAYSNYYNPSLYRL
jgi:hypothetical protein